MTPFDRAPEIIRVEPDCCGGTVVALHPHLFCREQRGPITFGSGSFDLAWQWRTNERPTSLVAGAQDHEVIPCLGETELSVRPAEHHICIRIVLAVVLPEAHGAYLKAAALRERDVLAARTRVRTVLPTAEHGIVPQASMLRPFSSSILKGCHAAGRPDLPR